MMKETEEEEEGEVVVQRAPDENAQNAEVDSTIRIFQEEGEADEVDYEPHYFHDEDEETEAKSLKL